MFNVLIIMPQKKLLKLYALARLLPFDNAKVGAPVSSYWE